MTSANCALLRARRNAAPAGSVERSTPPSRPSSEWAERPLATTVLGAGTWRRWRVDGSLYCAARDPRSAPLLHPRPLRRRGASVSALVSQLVRWTASTASPARSKGDESYFDSLRGEPSSGYAQDPFLEGTLQALRSTVAPPAQNGVRMHRPPMQPPAAVGLKNDGVTVHGSSGAAPPRRQRQLAQVQSPPSPSCSPNAPALRQLLRRDARQGSRHSLRRAGHGGRASVVSQTISAARHPPRVVDGSGCPHLIGHPL